MQHPHGEKSMSQLLAAPKSERQAAVTRWKAELEQCERRLRELEGCEGHEHERMRLEADILKNRARIDTLESDLPELAADLADLRREFGRDLT